MLIILIQRSIIHRHTKKYDPSGLKPASLPYPGIAPPLNYGTSEANLQKTSLSFVLIFVLFFAANLIVSWHKKISTRYFKIRLWESSDIIYVIHLPPIRRSTSLQTLPMSMAKEQYELPLSQRKSVNCPISAYRKIQFETFWTLD